MKYLLFFLLTGCGQIDKYAHISLVPEIKISGSTLIPFYLESGDIQCYTFHTHFILSIPRSISSTSQIPPNSLTIITIQGLSTYYYPSSMTFNSPVSKLTYDIKPEDKLCISTNTAGYFIYGSFTVGMNDIITIGPKGPSIWD